MNLELKGGANLYILVVDTCLSTKFQGGANAPLRPPPKINPGGDILKQVVHPIMM